MKELPDKANLTINEVAEFFGVHKKTIRRWMDEIDAFPKPFVVRYVLRFDRLEIIDFYEKNKKDLVLRDRGGQRGTEGSRHVK